MAAFPFHDFPFTLDTALFPNSAIEISGFLQEELNATSFPPDPSDSLSEIVFPQTNHKSSCFGNGATAAARVPVVDNLTPDSSSLVVEADGSGHMAHQQTATVRIRKNRDWTCSNSVQSKEAKGRRRQKKCSDSLKEAEDNEPKTDKKCQKKASEEPPTGYIHVRARRGQATDSHSLAERVRREKISERMKMLQALVPGCDRVIGKALVLDEIINYVRSLQNQVEFLSMKLACYGFGMDVEDCIVKSKVPGTALPFLCVQQSNPNQPTAFQDPTKLVFPPRSNYSSMDGSDPVLLQGQRPTNFLQENSNRDWEMDFRGEDSSNQAPYSNMYSFQDVLSISESSSGETSIKSRLLISVSAPNGWDHKRH